MNSNSIAKTFIEKLVLDETPSLEEIKDELYNICDETHAFCNDNCPVYRLISDEIAKIGACPCFKNGQKMYDTIRAVHAETDHLIEQVESNAEHHSKLYDYE